jgi:hypothetical protein
MIPKIIHYCWFGGNPLPKSAQKCIRSWKKYFPDYEIKEWNEQNFDVNSILYTRQAYERKKYAFVSDYARFHILYQYGGLYFDTDVEVIKPMDDLLAKGAFMGIEKDADKVGVAAGLGLAAEPKMSIYKEIVDHYHQVPFVDEDGNQIPGTVVKHVTDVLIQKGFALKDEIQQVADIWIYPNEYFNPLEDATGKLTITPNTRSIHWYSKTWVENYGPIRNWVTRWIHRLFGINSLSWLKSLINS